MSYKNRGLVDFSVDLDLSGLESRLDEIDAKLEEKEGGFDEDKVNSLIEDYIAQSDTVNESQVEEKLGDYVKSDDLDDMIRDYVGANNLMDSVDVDRAIDDKLDDYVTAMDVRDIIAEEGLNSSEVADADDVEKLQGEVADLTEKLTDLERRFDLYASKIDKLRDLGANDIDHRFEQMEEQAEALTQRIQRNEALAEQRYVEMHERNETAVTFFGLIQQAFDLLMQKRRGN